jgi:hypothetical protein
MSRRGKVFRARRAADAATDRRGSDGMAAGPETPGPLPRESHEMKEQLIREIAADVEHAYDEFLGAYIMAEGAREKGWTAPAIGQKFAHLDKCLWELMDCLNEAARRAPYTCSPSRTATETH